MKEVILVGAMAVFSLSTLLVLIMLWSWDPLAEKNRCRCTEHEAHMYMPPKE